MSIKKTAACLAVSVIILCSGCGETAATFNNLDSITEGAPRYIEGAYTEDIDADEFETLTGLCVQQSFPSSNTVTVSGYAEYDKDGNIINMSVGMSDDTNGFSAGISVYSTELWSDLSDSPVDYRYGGDETNNLVSAKIGQTEVLFFHYDDSKEKEYTLGYDVYIAEFELNGINVYVESNTMDQGNFTHFVTSLIQTAEEGE